MLKKTLLIALAINAGITITLTTIIMLACKDKGTAATAIGVVEAISAGINAAGIAFLKAQNALEGKTSDSERQV